MRLSDAITKDLPTQSTNLLPHTPPPNRRTAHPTHQSGRAGAVCLWDATQRDCLACAEPQALNGVVLKHVDVIIGAVPTLQVELLDRSLQVSKGGEWPPLQ